MTEMDKLPYEIKLLLFEKINTINLLEKLILISRDFYDILNKNNRHKVITDIIYRSRNIYNALNYSVNTNYEDGINKYLDLYGGIEEPLGISINKGHLVLAKYLVVDMDDNINLRLMLDYNIMIGNIKSVNCLIHLIDNLDLDIVLKYSIAHGKPHITNFLKSCIECKLEK
jgi:hypothetical protein